MQGLSGITIQTVTESQGVSVTIIYTTTYCSYNIYVASVISHVYITYCCYIRTYVCSSTCYNCTLVCKDVSLDACNSVYTHIAKYRDRNDKYIIP